ncbi:efflux RND transporter periplasmic adaptor subunit [Aristophania vespae]|uniref:Efflux RND transporter periplasmic adaptor subunit n=2 Tax=Aristophania vespae TaxID=2697033 RepID=A0A6P1NJJ0_9PROT|nr:efflux RND transporter periplasmic adaptor subunit [Aristophania vespae]QHI95031.1 efflux RND transporter periplasmic adaptor subunit [Aristophania vespae]UMM64211.1 Multidrug resistance protein MexA [Aristophania vespae]
MAVYNLSYRSVSAFRKSWGYNSLALLAGVALLSGCQKKASPPPKPQTVDVIKMHPQQITLETSLPGRTSAFEQSEIRPQVDGVIVSRNFEQGKDVKAGQQLYQIYLPPYQAAYDQAKGKLMEAKATAARAEAQLKRYRHLVGPRAVSQQEFDNTLAAAREAEAQVVQAKAALETAAVNVRYTHVLSPIDGRIGRTLYTEGTLVTAGQAQPIAIVTRLDPIYVDVNVAAKDMLRLRRELDKGQIQRVNEKDAAVTVELSDGSTYEKTGSLQLSEVTVDPETGTLVMRAVMPNPDYLLLPGMFVHAHIKEGIDSSALLVPQVAVQRNTKAQPYVMVIDDENKVDIRIIEIARSIGASWLVKSGLKPGDRVIISGLQKIRVGAKVAPHFVDFKEVEAE